MCFFEIYVFNLSEYENAFYKTIPIFQLKLCIVLVLNFISKLLDLLDQSHYLWYIHFM
jgi:hypothetical protein